MDDRLAIPVDLDSGWTKARMDLLRSSVDRTYALIHNARPDDESWRTTVAAETFLREAITGAAAPTVPPRFAETHERTETMPDLTNAGTTLREAIREQDVDLLITAMGQMDAAQKAAKAVFVVAFRGMGGV